MPDIRHPHGGGQNLGRLAFAHCFYGIEHVGTARLRLSLFAGYRDIVQPTPEAVDPDRTFQFVAGARKPIAASFTAEAGELDGQSSGADGICRLFRGIGGCGAERQQHGQ